MYFTTIVAAALVAGASAKSFFSMGDNNSKRYNTERYCDVARFCASEFIAQPVFEHQGSMKAIRWVEDALRQEGYSTNPETIQNTVLSAECDRESGYINHIRVEQVCDNRQSALQGVDFCVSPNQQSRHQSRPHEQSAYCLAESIRGGQPSSYY